MTGRAFDDPGAIGLLRLGTTDGNCGRIELRRHTVCHDMAAIRHIA